MIVSVFRSPLIVWWSAPIGLSFHWSNNRAKEVSTTFSVVRVERTRARRCSLPCGSSRQGSICGDGKAFRSREQVNGPLLVWQLFNRSSQNWPRRRRASRLPEVGALARASVLLRGPVAVVGGQAQAEESFLVGVFQRARTSGSRLKRRRERRTSTGRSPRSRNGRLRKMCQDFQTYYHGQKEAHKPDASEGISLAGRVGLVASLPCRGKRCRQPAGQPIRQRAGDS